MKTKEPPYTERYVRWCGRSVDKIIIYLLPDLSNETRQFGAISMLYPEVLKKFCVEKMIDGVFVIPSSIHEVLLMIADKNMADVEYIRRMIKEVNNENVSEVERLSDSLYYYDVATDTLRIAE